MELEQFELLLSDLHQGAVLGSHALLSALQEYFRELDVCNLRVRGEGVGVQWGRGQCWQPCAA